MNPNKVVASGEHYELNADGRFVMFIPRDPAPPGPLTELQLMHWLLHVVTAFTNEECSKAERRAVAELERLPYRTLIWIGGKIRKKSFDVRFRKKPDVLANVLPFPNFPENLAA